MHTAAIGFKVFARLCLGVGVARVLRGRYAAKVPCSSRSGLGWR